MPVQDNASLRMIQQANACFGTMRFTEACEDTFYRYNLAFKNGQLPSIYCADNPDNSNQSLRLRPYHNHGFNAVGGATRLYWAVAGLTGEIDNPRTALSTEMEQVCGPVYQSRYYVFVRLGVDRNVIQQSLQALIASVPNITTQQLVDLNAAQEAVAGTIAVFINEGALSGTYWAIKNPVWTNALDGGARNNLYRPMTLVDFRLPDDDVDTAQGDDMAAAVQLMPENRDRVHRGHGLITVDGLQTYYGTQNYPNGQGGQIPGGNIWTNLFRLGAYKQYFGLASNGVPGITAEIQPRQGIYRRNMFEYFPYYDHDRDDDTKAQLQLAAICNMINNFVDN
ncbi:MAG: hypothetical protein ABJL55_14390 [Roseibium sp.]